MRLQLASVGALVVLTGCWSPSPEVNIANPNAFSSAKGTIEVIVSDDTTRFHLVLESGAVRNQEHKSGPAFELVRQEQNAPTPAVPNPSGFSLGKPTALSHDAKSIAAAMRAERGDANAVSDVIGILDKSTGRLHSSYKLRKGLHVEALAWAPSSDAIVVLSAEDSSGKSGRDLLSAMSGHPVSYLSFNLHLVNRDGALVGETGVATGMRAGFGYVSWK
jgi:hypothetical protein